MSGIYSAPEDNRRDLGANRSKNPGGTLVSDIVFPGGNHREARIFRSGSRVERSAYDCDSWS